MESETSSASSGGAVGGNGGGGTAALFGSWDYLVFASTLLVSSGIGLYYRFSGGKQKTAEEYLLGKTLMVRTVLRQSD